MPTFGQKLKAEREKRSITLDQISLTTKIGTRMLQALEEDKFSQLPGGIFNKGFVRAYARCVGIDEEQAVSDYLEAAGESPRPPSEGEAASPAPRIVLSEEPRGFGTSKQSSRELPWGLFAAALLVIALGLSVWTNRKHQGTPAAAPAASSSPAAASNPAPTANVPSTGGAANSGNVVSAKQVAPSATINQTSGAITPEKARGKLSAMPSEAKAPAVPPGSAQPGEFTVLIQGKEDCWLSITADGKAMASYLLNAGEERTVHGRQLVVIKAGNVGGLDVSFNGKNLASQGESGEVKTLSFGPAGLQASPPASVETP